MIFQAVVSNKAHPEHGQATIPLPIPDSDYDQAIELLEELAIGSPTGQDCRVDLLDSKYPILKRLVTQSVNVDELDYLAKRLESFCPDEDAQFQAMASKMCLSDIQDFINLTFCCQQATVITDFSDLERVGKAHSLTTNGGSMGMVPPLIVRLWAFPTCSKSEKSVITVACWQQNVRLMKSWTSDRHILEAMAWNWASSSGQKLSSRLAR